MSSLRRFRAGSLIWLLAHEIRLFFYDMGGTKTSQQKIKRGIGKRRLIFMLAVALLMHIPAWFLVPKLSPFLHAPPRLLVVASSLVLLLCFSWMLSAALTRSVSALFERGDMDLLLSSPLPSYTIFSARLAAVALDTSSLLLIVLSPFAHIGLLFGEWRWLGIYPTLISLAMIASSCAMLLTLALVRLIGVRRTLTTAQVIGALTGAALFLGSQLFVNAGDGIRGKIIQTLTLWLQDNALFDTASWLWLPAKALLGSPLALLGFALLGLIVFYCTVRYTHHFFVTGLQQVSGMSHQASTQVAKLVSAKKFQSGLVKNVLVKEWRLIRRDPQLISQVLLQLLYMLPMLFIVLRNNHQLPIIAAMICFITSSLSSSLIWIIISGEDAPDLLHAAPAPYHTIRNVKLAAATIPILLLIFFPAFWITIQNPAQGILLIVVWLLAILSSALIQLWHSKPTKRSAFKQRGQGNLLAAMIEFICALGWAATIFFSATSGWWGCAPLAVAILALGIAWISRKQDA
jgi:ABC-2 type transport system permease protein